MDTKKIVKVGNSLGVRLNSVALKLICEIAEGDNVRVMYQRGKITITKEVTK